MQLPHWTSDCILPHQPYLIPISLHQIASTLDLQLWYGMKPTNKTNYDNKTRHIDVMLATQGIPLAIFSGYKKTNPSLTRARICQDTMHTLDRGLLVKGETKCFHTSRGK